MDDVPIGVIRERGMARCCMADKAEMAVLRSKGGGTWARVAGAAGAGAGQMHT